MEITVTMKVMEIAGDKVRLIGAHFAVGQIKMTLSNPTIAKFACVGQEIDFKVKPK